MFRIPLTYYQAQPRKAWLKGWINLNSPPPLLRNIFCNWFKPTKLCIQFFKDTLTWLAARFPSSLASPENYDINYNGVKIRNHFSMLCKIWTIVSIQNTEIFLFISPSVRPKVIGSRYTDLQMAFHSSIAQQEYLGN